MAVMLAASPLYARTISFEDLPAAMEIEQAQMNRTPQVMLMTDQDRGIFFLEEIDYQGAGQFPLGFSRVYAPYLSDTPLHGFPLVGLEQAEDLDTPLAVDWQHNYQSGVRQDPTGRNLYTVCRSGRCVTFDGFGGSALSPEVRDTFARNATACGQSFRFVWRGFDSGLQEGFDGMGRLMSRFDANCVEHRLAYSANQPAQLASVTHVPSGRQLRFAYNAAGRLETLIDPAGRRFTFAFQRVASTVSGIFGERLVSVTYPEDGINPGSFIRRYEYQNFTNTAGSCVANLQDARSCLLSRTLDGETLQHAFFYAYPPTPRDDVRRHGVYTSIRYPSHNGDRHVVSRSERLLSDGSLRGDEGREVTIAQDFSADRRISTSTPPDEGTYTRVFRYERVNAAIATSIGDIPIRRLMGVDRRCGDCDGDFASYRYNNRGDLLQTVDFLGNRTEYRDLDARGLPGRIVEAANRATNQQRTTRLGWDSRFPLPISMSVDGVARTVTMAYDSNRNRIRETIRGDGNNRTTIIAHTRRGNGIINQTVRTGPRSGERTTLAYDNGGDLIRVSNALNQVETYADYNAHGLPGSRTGIDGVVTTYGYDRLRRLIAQNVGGDVTAFAYSRRGLIRQITRPDGTVLSLTPNDAGSIRTISRGDETLRLVRNNRGQIKERLHLSGTSTRVRLRRAFSAAGRLREVFSSQSGTFVRYRYDANGNLITIDNSGSLTETLDYNDLDQRVSSTMRAVASRRLPG